MNLHFNSLYIKGIRKKGKGLKEREKIKKRRENTCYIRVYDGLKGGVVWWCDVVINYYLIFAKLVPRLVIILAYSLWVS